MGQTDYRWQGDTLYRGKQKVGGIIPDTQFAAMWHAHWPDGRTAGPLNRIRAKDAAVGRLIYRDYLKKKGVKSDDASHRSNSNGSSSAW